MLDTLIYDLVLTLFCNIACRLARRREYERSRREAMGTRGGAVDEGAGETTELSPSIFHNLVVDDPEIIQILQQFHSNLATLENVMCNTCLEQFPCITTDVTGLCRVNCEDNLGNVVSIILVIIGEKKRIARKNNWKV